MNQQTITSSTPQPPDRRRTRPTEQTFGQLRERFVRVLSGRNRSPHTLTAYDGDLRQFFTWLGDTHPGVADVGEIERAHLHDYMTHLATARLSGVSRARKLTAIREFFKHLQTEGVRTASPVTGVPSPKKERKQPTVLTRSEYSRLLAEAATHPRDFAILTLFLQTGVRVSELADLRLRDVDLGAHALKVRGKGQVERVIELERKSTAALKRFLAVREIAGDDHLFLNRYGEGLGVRGIRKLLVTYCRKVGLQKAVGPHALRHTFGTAKAEQGVDPYQLQEWFGHANITTTMGYVHRAKSKHAQKVMEETSL